MEEQKLSITCLQCTKPFTINEDELEIEILPPESDPTVVYDIRYFMQASKEAYFADCPHCSTRNYVESQE